MSVRYISGTIPKKHLVFFPSGLSSFFLIEPFFTLNLETFFIEYIDVKNKEWCELSENYKKVVSETLGTIRILRNGNLGTML